MEKSGQAERLMYPALQAGDTVFSVAEVFEVGHPAHVHLLVRRAKHGEIGVRIMEADCVIEFTCACCGTKRSFPDNTANEKKDLTKTNLEV
jgi:hypothetical protein